MRRRKREEPTSPVDVFRLIMEAGRRSDRAKAEAKQFAQDGYDKHGPEFIEHHDDLLTVDEHGRVHVPGEHRTWANGSLMLDHLADTAEGEGWNGEVIAAYLGEWTKAGHEPAAAVLEVVRELAGPGRFLPPAEVAAMLRERADRIERESEAAADGR